MRRLDHAMPVRLCCLETLFLWSWSRSVLLNESNHSISETITPHFTWKKLCFPFGIVLRLNVIFLSHLTSGQFQQVKMPFKFFPCLLTPAHQTKLQCTIWSCFRGPGNSFQLVLDFLWVCWGSCFFKFFLKEVITDFKMTYSEQCVFILFTSKFPFQKLIIQCSKQNQYLIDY